MRLKNVLAGGMLCLLALVFSPVRAQAGDPNAVFATVNGDEIKSSEFWHRLAWYRIDTANPLSTLPAGFLAINQLVTERLIYQMARDKGCSPTDPEIEAELKKREAENPNLLTDMKSEGRPESDLYDQVKYDMAQFNLQTFGITITDQEIEDHYNKYTSEFTRPKQYKLSVIVVNSDADATAVDQELAGGKKFSEVASDHSLDVSKNVGGDFGTVPISDLGAPAATALNAIKIGQTTAWVTGTQSKDVRVKYLLENIVPSLVVPLDDKLKDQIRHKLSLDRGSIKNQVLVDLHKATVSAQVSIHQAGFQKIYDQLLSSYNAAHPAAAPKPAGQ